MNLGISLPFRLLCAQPAAESEEALVHAYGSLRGLLDTVRALGVNSIELRAVHDATAPADVLLAARNCREAGFHVTIHGALSAPETFFAPYRDLLTAGLQEHCTVTVHTVGDAETPVLLKALAHPSLRLVLENNRRRGEPHMGQTCEGVRQLVESVGPEQGICWDWGHYCWNLQQAGIPEDTLPASEFLRRVRHTHIHGVSNNTTHYPLTGENLPLRRYIRALKEVGYTGVYNLELSFPRFFDQYAPRQALEGSIAVLREAYEHA